MTIGQRKETYDRDGFLKIDQLFTEERMREIESQLSNYMRDVVPRLSAEDVVYEPEPDETGRKTIRNLWRMEHHSDYFAELARDADLLELVGRLVNGEPHLMAVELFAKPPKVGSPVPYHQDNAYFNYTPPDVLTCWIALDDSTLENGCVYYARGTHRHGVFPHEASGVAGNSQKLAVPPSALDLVEEPGVLSRGGAILHHCCLIHRSEQNLSARPRRGYSSFTGAPTAKWTRQG